MSLNTLITGLTASLCSPLTASAQEFVMLPKSTGKNEIVRMADSCLAQGMSDVPDSMR